MSQCFARILGCGCVLALLGGAAGAQQRQTGSSAAIESALQAYAQESRAEEPAPQLKAVPRTDKAEASIIGTVVLVDATDFLSDGTPFRLVVVRSRKPINQDVIVVCLGSAFNSSCGRLGVGRRASFIADVLVIEDGDSAGLALLIVKKLQT